MVQSGGDISAAARTEPRQPSSAHEEDMMDNPEPTETEHELAGTERHTEEEDMRGAPGADEDNLPTEDE